MRPSASRLEVGLAGGPGTGIQRPAREAERVRTTLRSLVAAGRRGPCHKVGDTAWQRLGCGLDCGKRKTTVRQQEASGGRIAKPRPEKESVTVGEAAAR